MVLISSIVSMSEAFGKKCLIEDSKIEGEETGASNSKGD